MESAGAIDPADVRLMEAVGRGDQDAFATLYALHAPRLFGVLQHLTGDRQHAEDVLQDVFLRAWRAAPRWRPTAPVAVWLLTIARRASWNANAFRRRRRAVERPASAGEGEESRAAAPETGDPLVRAEEVARLRAAIRALTPRLRLVFVLARLSGCSLAETARIVGASAGTVKSRLHAADASVRERLLRGASPSDRTRAPRRGS